MSSWEDFSDEELWDSLSDDEEITEEEIADLEDFIEEVYEIGDAIEGYDGPTVIMTIEAGGETFEVEIPAEFVPDIIDLASEMDIEIEVESA